MRSQTGVSRQVVHAVVVVVGLSYYGVLGAVVDIHVTLEQAPID